MWSEILCLKSCWMNWSLKVITLLPKCLIIVRVSWWFNTLLEFNLAFPPASDLNVHHLFTLSRLSEEVSLITKILHDTIINLISHVYQFCIKWCQDKSEAGWIRWIMIEGVRQHILISAQPSIYSLDDFHPLFFYHLPLRDCFAITPVEKWKIILLFLFHSLLPFIDNTYLAGIMTGVLACTLVWLQSGCGRGI